MLSQTSEIGRQISEIDTQYRQLLKTILDHGEQDKAQQGVDTISMLAPLSLRFKIQEGFPIITERRISEKMWRQAIGEMIGFMHGARTQAELESYGCNWWKHWATPEKCAKRGLEAGDLGPGSYGAAFHDFPMADGGSFNQFQAVVEQIKELPHLKTHFISPWIPQYQFRGQGKQQKVVVCPCHGWIHFRVLNGKLSLHMFQRSSDVPIGLPANLAQYGALLLMMAEVTGYEPYEYIHSFSDAHIFVDQVPKIQELLTRPPLPLPQMVLKNKKSDLFAYRVEDFELVDYEPNLGMWDIPVAV
ncbi:MAG TPA: thymidylate synthase [Candidatus Pacebacteria bacterium]|nr:thymidylate synthase [Candidatus Paceibacterota bacterium]